MKKLFVVEDSTAVRTMIRFALRDHFAVEEFADAGSAHARIMLSRPDGIVLDVMMPGSMDGYQLCERIKSDQALAGIHVVLVTARGQVSDQEYGLSLGADAYFVKPFSPLALVSHLRTALQPAPEIAA